MPRIVAASPSPKFSEIHRAWAWALQKPSGSIQGIQPRQTKVRTTSNSSRQPRPTHRTSSSILHTWGQGGGTKTNKTQLMFSCKSKLMTMIMGTIDDGNAADDVFSKDFNYTKGTLVNVTTNAVRGNFPHLNRYQNPDDFCSIRFLFRSFFCEPFAVWVFSSAPSMCLTGIACVP